MRAATSRFLLLLQMIAASWLLCSPALAFADLAHEPLPYIEPGFATRFYGGDEDVRLGRVHFISGNYGLAEMHFQRAVERTPQNGAAWIGLAACYDRLARFDLADRAYRYAVRLEGTSYLILNNWGYSHLLRGDRRGARRLLNRALRLAPDDPTINNNIAVLEAGQDYFLGVAP